MNALDFLNKLAAEHGAVSQAAVHLALIESQEPTNEPLEIRRGRLAALLESYGVLARDNLKEDLMIDITSEKEFMEREWKFSPSFDLDDYTQPMGDAWNRAAGRYMALLTVLDWMEELNGWRVEEK